MSKIQHDVMLRVVKILNVLMIELPFAGCWFLYYSHQTYANLAWEGHFAILGLFFILYIVLGKIYDAFWMSMQRVSELVYGQILGAMATDGILYIVICLMSAKLCNLLPGIAAIAGQLVMPRSGHPAHINGTTRHSRRRRPRWSTMCDTVWKSSSTSMV